MQRRFTVRWRERGRGARLTLLLLVACARADSGAAATGDEAAGAGAGSVSEAEWLELTGPQPGVHEVYDAACGGERIAQEYRIQPTVSCAVRRDASGTVTLTRDCTVADYCASADECTEQPGGVCRGSAYAACEYAGFDEEAPCERDTDCSALPGGSCAVHIGGGTEHCYPTGECSTTPLQTCVYPALGQPCASDADCAAAPGGICRRTLAFTECGYNECDAHADCGPAARCECQGVRRCVPSDCFADTDCAAGYRCEPSLAVQCGNLRPPAGFHCHAAVDECRGDADCDGNSCVYDPAVAHWACREVRCFD
jgi:hypothetical protein